MFALPKWITDIKKLFGTADGKVLGRFGGAWVFLSSFAPSAHAGRHATEGDDPIAPADIGAVSVDDWDLKAPIVNRKLLEITTASLGSIATESGSLSLGKTFAVLKVNVTSPCRIRLYSTSSARDADSSREPTSPPEPGEQHGVILDLVLNAETGFAWILSPSAYGSNGDDPENNNIYYAIQNIDSSQTQITVNFVYIELEG